MTFVHKELLTKNGIIKSLTETQITILEALSSFKFNQQFGVIKLTYKPVRNNINLHHQQYHHNNKSRLTTLFIMNAYKVQIEVSVMTKRQEQIQSVLYTPKQKFKQIAYSSETQTLYIGNLSDNNIEDDLYEFLGLRSTKCVKKNLV